MKYDNPIKVIEQSEDVNFLTLLLEKYIPIDEKNLAEGKNKFLHEMEARSRKISVEKVIKEKEKGIANLKAIVEKRLKELSNKDKK